MKILTIFSEKGGMGKTTLSMMFASWLAYDRKETVYVYDFDYPGYQMMNMRKRDLEILERGGSQLSVLAEGNDFFKMGPVKGNYAGYTPGQLATIANKISELKQSGEGYVLCDFPGRFMRTDPAYHLIRENLIDLIVFPIDSDIQSITSMLNINSIIRNPKVMPFGKSQKILVMWNRETANERKGNRDWYSQYETLFSQMGIHVAKTRMRNIEILRRDPPTFGFVRNTVCWPAQNVKQRCPYVDDLFMEIKDAVDGKEQERKTEKENKKEE